MTASGVGLQNLIHPDSHVKTLQVRVAHEDQIVVIKEQKAERLRQIETEEAVQLEILRQNRDVLSVEFV